MNKWAMKWADALTEEYKEVIEHDCNIDPDLDRTLNSIKSEVKSALDEQLQETKLKDINLQEKPQIILLNGRHYPVNMENAPEFNNLSIKENIEIARTLYENSKTNEKEKLEDEIIKNYISNTGMHKSILKKLRKIYDDLKIDTYSLSRSSNPKTIIKLKDIEAAHNILCSLLGDKKAVKIIYKGLKKKLK